MLKLGLQFLVLLRLLLEVFLELLNLVDFNVGEFMHICALGLLLLNKQLLAIRQLLLFHRLNHSHKFLLLPLHLLLLRNQHANFFFPLGHHFLFDFELVQEVLIDLGPIKTLLDHALQPFDLVVKFLVLGITLLDFLFHFPEAWVSNDLLGLDLMALDEVGLVHGTLPDQLGLHDNVPFIVKVELVYLLGDGLLFVRLGLAVVVFLEVPEPVLVLFLDLGPDNFDFLEHL